MKITRRKFIGACGGLALLSMGIRSSGYLEKALDYNPSNEIKESKHINDIKFITVGDPHAIAGNKDNRENISDSGNKRLGQVINFANKTDVDFVVFLGDMANDGTAESNELVKDILKNLNKPYYIIAGNHDLLVSNRMFEEYYGPMERIESVNGYQLLFVGIYREKDANGEILKWSFDFNKADKSAPTFAFIHGPITDLPIECIHCQIKDKRILEYAKGAKKELDKFSNLIGVYSGHIHYDSDQVINGTRYVTVNGLKIFRIGSAFNELNDFRAVDFKIVNFSDKVGYSEIKDGEYHYQLVPY